MEYTIGQILLFSYDATEHTFFKDRFLPCDGRLLPISSYTMLFAFMGDNFGGDGRRTFALPDLRGRVPIGLDTFQYHFALKGGAETVTLNNSQMPEHLHRFPLGPGMPKFPPGSGSHLAALVPGVPAVFTKSPSTATQKMNEKAIGEAGVGVPHDNMQPSIALNFYICYRGLLPINE